MKTILPIIVTVFFLFALSLPSLQTLLPKQLNDQDIPFHTPIHSVGKSLPTYIEVDTIIGPQDGVILIHAVTTIKKGASLIIQPGTTIVVDEYGGIQVFGNLIAEGTRENPIRFTTNERNEKNRNWSGILFEKTGHGSIVHTNIHHASPAISCSVPETVNIRDTTTLYGNLDLYGPC